MQLTKNLQIEFWFSDHCVHGAFTEKILLPSEVKESHFFLVCLLWLYSFLAKTPPFFSSFKATEAKLSLDLPTMLVEHFFSHQGLSTFYFQAMGGAKKSQLFNSYQH